MFAKLFGYTREELLNKPITCLMPEIYAAPHTELFKSVKKANVRHPNEEIFIFGQNRTKYVFPAYLRVLRTASMLNAFTYVASIQDKTPFINSRKAYVLLGPKLNIVGISSGWFFGLFGQSNLLKKLAAIGMLRLDSERIRDQEVLITQYCPAITPENIHIFYNKWTEVEYWPSRRKSSTNLSSREQILLPPDKDRVLLDTTRTILKVQAGSIKFHVSSEVAKIIGYYCIFASMEDNTGANSTAKELEDQGENTVTLVKINKAEKFQFRFDPNTNLFVRELADDAPSLIQYIPSPKPLPSEATPRAQTPRGELERSNKSEKSFDTMSFRKGTFYGLQDARVKYLSRFVKNMGGDNASATGMGYIPELKEFLQEYVMSFWCRANQKMTTKTIGK